VVDILSTIFCVLSSCQYRWDLNERSSGSSSIATNANEELARSVPGRVEEGKFIEESCLALDYRMREEKAMSRQS